jgi:hypothetical protein
MRFIFHTFDFDNFKIGEFLYFVGNDLGLIGFLLVIKNQTYTSKTIYFSKKKQKRMINVIIIYAAAHLVIDVLMLSGIGNCDSWYYTSILSLILITAVCSIFV